MCDICNNESGGKDIGVAAVPGAPVSIMWCDECLKRDTAPAFVFEHDFIYVLGGKLENANDWALSRETWADGRYMQMREYVQRISPKEVEKALLEYEEAMSGEDSDD